jgi:hypothetical protein
MALVSDDVAGDPIHGRRWIRRSLSSLENALNDSGHRLSRGTIRRWLSVANINLKSNVKRLTPTAHPARDTQFTYLQSQREAFRLAGWPIISVDTKKKELIGPFYQDGQTWCDQPPQVYMHDFPTDALARTVPYGIYDERRRQGHMYVGLSADTAELAVDAIIDWWCHFGQPLFPDAPELLILADGGGSNGYRSRLWKQQLQSKLVDAFGLSVTVCHYPPGASKWNPIEHRLFSEISKTWAGTPLTSIELMLACIRDTKTTTGLTVRATLIDKTYDKGIKVSDQEMEGLAIQRHDTCPNWNYTLRSRKTGSNL